MLYYPRTPFLAVHRIPVSLKCVPLLNNGACFDASTTQWNPWAPDSCSSSSYFTLPNSTMEYRKRDVKTDRRHIWDEKYRTLFELELERSYCT